MSSCCNTEHRRTTLQQPTGKMDDRGIKLSIASHLYDITEAKWDQPMRDSGTRNSQTFTDPLDVLAFEGIFAVARAGAQVNIIGNRSL